jgi:hypothetical protein
MLAHAGRCEQPDSGTALYGVVGRIEVGSQYVSERPEPQEAPAQDDRGEGNGDGSQE